MPEPLYRRTPKHSNPATPFWRCCHEFSQAPDRGFLFLSCLYIAVGTIGFVVNLPKLIALQHESIWIELTELLALIAGAFMFRGRNWAQLASRSSGWPFI